MLQNVLFRAPTDCGIWRLLHHSTRRLYPTPKFSSLDSSSVVDLLVGILPVQSTTPLKDISYVKVAGRVVVR